MSSPSVLTDRYGAPSPTRRWVVAGVVAAVVMGFLAWLAWATWFHATPPVESEPVGYTVESDHAATITVAVTMDDGVAATCTVRALAADHMTVGEVTFTPVPGRNEVEVRTERRASTVTLLGCTAEGQPRPR